MISREIPTKYIQMGRVLELKDDKQHIYSVALMDTGGVVEAMPTMPSTGYSTKYNAEDFVICANAANFWYILGVMPKFDKTENLSPRVQDMTPGEAFVGHAETGSGLHVTPGVVSLECGDVDDKGKGKRAAGVFLVPTYDAIRNLCRRFHVDSAVGDIITYHDDDSGQTALRLFAKQTVETGQDGKNVMLHMGHHKSPADAVFSITVFPPGPDPMAALMTPSISGADPTHKEKFGGAWKDPERKDYETRFYIQSDGTTVYETSDQNPVSSPAPTTLKNVTVKIDPEGFIDTTAMQNITTIAMNYALTCRKDITLKALVNYGLHAVGNVTIKSDKDTIITTLDLGEWVCENLSLGVMDDIRQLCKQAVFEYMRDELKPWLDTHTHFGVMSGAGSTQPPTAPSPALPEDTEALTQNVNAS